MIEGNTAILEYVKHGGKQVWIGRLTPFNMTAVEMLRSSGYRVSSVHHHQYEVVWFYETLLDDVGKLGWKIVVDELTRLIAVEGRLILRLRNNQVPSFAMLKRFLGRHACLTAELEFESYDRIHDIWTVVFKIARKHMEQYSAQDWTFAVLTTGKKPDNVVRFLESIRRHEPNGDSEIIVVGPQNERYNAYGVRYIDTSSFRDDRYAEISKKKNAVIETATKTNLMIVHDRFVLAPNFFDGFERYGYDFDFVTVLQHTEDGEEYPCYAATNEYMRFAGQIWVKEFTHLYDTQYINGGLIIMKTQTARRISFNKMLMWAQMEDVELSEICMEHGVIPRVNFISEAVVLENPKGYLDSFREEKLPEPAHEPVAPCVVEPYLFWAVNRVTRRIPARFKENRAYRKLKGLYWRRALLASSAKE